MASTTIERLLLSDDAVDRETAEVLLRWQEAKALLGRRRSLGREPRLLTDHSSVEVIVRRVRNRSIGFAEVPPEHSYEAIVVRHPHRFPPDVVGIARQRIEGGNDHHGSCERRTGAGT